MTSFAAELRRDAVALHGCSHAHRSGEARAFALPGTERVYERDRPFTIEHIALDLHLDVAHKVVRGTAKLFLRRIAPQAMHLLLDAVAMQLHSVQVVVDDGEAMAARFDYDGRVLRIRAPKAERFEVHVRYEAKPTRGLYFLAPDEHVTQRPRQVWSQCQDEDARCWFPCIDKPHVKQTTELRVTAPKGWETLSNGTLVERRDVRDQTVWHWKQELPHPSYLVTLVAGEYTMLEESASVPLSYYIPKGREEDAKRGLGRTAEILRCFERKLGVPFPWVKYAQAIVADFTFAGMENTSATTLYDAALLDERAALDVDMDGLVAHELAHQWFGDYVTCRDFAEGWLNEGWATYLELLWKEETTGRDDYDYALKGELDRYLDEDGHHYRRTLVCRDYEAPTELFDRHLYQKGALVLHSIRRLVGDEAFWAATHRYLKAHAFGVVESRDLQRAFEEVSGKSLDRLFDAYVHGAGHPQFSAVVTYEPAVEGEGGHVCVALHQTQELDTHTKLYRGPLTLEIGSSEGAKRVVVTVATAKDVLVIPVAERPRWVALDPDAALLATFDCKAPPDMWRAQLQSAPLARQRWLAAAALGRNEELATLDALAAALDKHDEFWGVRAEAATALGQLRTPEAFEVLLRHGSTAHPKVRRAVVRAMGCFRTAAAASTLAALALKEPSYLVASEGAKALGATRQPSAFDTLVELLDRPAWNDAVRSGAAEGLAELRDDRALPHLVSRTAYGHASRGRRACMGALARLEPSRKTRELLEDRLSDPDVFVRDAAVAALVVLGDRKATEALEARLEREGDANVRKHLRIALRQLTGGREDELRRLRDDFDKLREESQELRARLAKLEAPKPAADGSVRPKSKKSAKKAARRK